MHELAVSRWDSGERETALRIWQQGCAVFEWLEARKSYRGSSFPYVEALTMLGRDEQARKIVKDSGYDHDELLMALRRLGRAPEVETPTPKRPLTIYEQIEYAMEQADWEKALTLVEKISPHALYERHAAAARAKIAAHLWLAGEQERAVALLERAEEEARMIMPSQRNETLHCIAESWVVCDRERARQLYQEAVETLQSVPKRYRTSPDRLITSLEASGFYEEIPELLEEIPDWNEGPSAHLASLRHGIKCVQQEPTTEALEDLTDAVRRAVTVLRSHHQKTLVEEAVDTLLNNHCTPFTLEDMQLLREHEWHSLFAVYFCHLHESGKVPGELWPLQPREESAIRRYLPTTRHNPEKSAQLLRALEPSLDIVYTLVRLERFDDARAVLHQLQPQEHWQTQTELEEARGVIEVQESPETLRMIEKPPLEEATPPLFGWLDRISSRWERTLGRVWRRRRS